MTNPGQVIGTNGAYGGRTGVKAFNDQLAMLTGRGVLSGWECEPAGGLTVQLGGKGIARDVAVAENATGDRISVNNRSEMPVEVELEEAPETGSRVDAIVAYVMDPPISTATYVDNPDACGLIVVSGAVATSPTAPDEAAIRQGITMDGASGETAYYVVLATVTVLEGMTDVTNVNIAAGAGTYVQADAEMSDNSPNPAQNKVVKAYVDGKTVVDSALDSSSQRPVQNRVVTAAVVGDTEDYTIAASAWTGATDAEPFAYKTAVTASHTITANTIAELYNDNAVGFANYGFAIASISGQTVTIYALQAPSAAVTLTINYKG